VISTALDAAGSIRVSVRDCGTGLSSGAIEKLFNPFFTTKNSGMGIGLSISRTIVESHKGRLWAENNNGPAPPSASRFLPPQPNTSLAALAAGGFSGAFGGRGEGCAGEVGSLAGNVSSSASSSSSSAWPVGLVIR
jgi:signal transduction histidine kinase